MKRYTDKLPGKWKEIKDEMQYNKHMKPFNHKLLGGDVVDKTRDFTPKKQPGRKQTTGEDLLNKAALAFKK